MSRATETTAEEVIEVTVESTDRWIDVGDEPELEALNVPELLREFNRRRMREKQAKQVMERWKKRKDAIGASLHTAIEFVKAKGITYTGIKTWRATLVTSLPSKSLNEERLRENLMKKCGLTAERIAEVWALSQDDVPAKKSYVIVTVSEKK
jgi:hypothetical protein